MQYLLSILLILFPSFAFAGWPAKSEEDEFFSLERASLEDTLNVKTSVATKSAMNLRETPGLVAVITREEIQALGARDLIDVLKLVPEFDFGVDVQGNLGLAVRGNWANEGKVLLIWDGQVYNEPLYSTVQFDRFPVDQIEQIEIIKGPGSVVYGGNAELAVINIHTLSAKTLKGSDAFAGYGQGTNARAREYAGYSFGNTFGKTDIAAKAFLGGAQRSDRRYTDFSGASYAMNGNSRLRPENLNLSVARGDSSFRLILDDFYLTDRDHFGSVLSTGPSKVQFPAVFAEARHTIWLPGLVRLEPSLNYAKSQAWLEKDNYFGYDKKTERVTAALTAFYHPGQYADFMGGTEYYHDAVKVDDITAAGSQYGNGSDSARYDNYAFFGQGNFPLEFVNLTAGARYDKHSQYGSSLVPRVAATRLAGDFNLKAIYSQAFRAPSIENIRLNPAIKPEKTTSEEFEAGYKASETVFLSANVFDIAIKDPIIFNSSTTPAGTTESYRNYDRTGTAGFGLGFKFKSGASRADLSYQCYMAHDNRVDVYSVPLHASYLLGFPRHKFTLTASLPLGPGLSLNPSAIYLSRRYGYAGDGSLKVFGERVMTDLNLRMKDRLLKGLALDLGVKDLFKSGYSYIQPYDGGHAPLPAGSREIFIKADYGF